MSAGSTVVNRARKSKKPSASGKSTPSLSNVLRRARKPTPNRIPPNSAPLTYPMPPTTVSMSSCRLRKMSKRSRLADPICEVMSAPPTPAMAADSMNTDSFSDSML